MIHEFMKFLKILKFWKFWKFEILEFCFMISWFMSHEILIFYLILDYVVFLSFSPLEDRRIKVATRRNDLA